MEEQNRKIGFVIAAEDETRPAFQSVETGAKEMAAAVAKSAEQAAKGVKGIGDGADEAAQKMGRAESAMAQALTRATEKAKIAAQAGESLSRAFEQKIEMRGLDATKLNPLVAKLREAEDALAAFKAQQARDAGQSSFLESLRAQADALGKTKSELLALQAAQLGVTNQAAPYIAKLRETEAGIGRVGMSAAQTAQAMRMVPAQFTDIVVSLQAGQAPLTVLLQQGGQLKDMFGTTGAAARGLASYVAGLVSPYTAAGAAAAILGLAYYQGSKESDAFRKSILLTGNQAGVTVDQLNTMAQAMAGVVGTQGTAAAGLAEMTRGSKVGADSLQEFSTVAIQWEKATGQAVKDTAKQFAELAKDPLQASLRLNEEMNHLTASVYDQIKALDKQGKTAEAAAVAQKAYADAMSSRRAEMVQNLGYIEAGWNKVKNAAKKAWDAILDIGREGAAEQKLASVQRDLQAAERQLANAERAAFGGSRASKAEEDRRRAAVEDLREQEKSLRDGIAAGQKKAADQVASKDYVDAMQAFDQVAGQFASKEVKRKQELTVAQNLYNEAVEKTKKALANSPELAGKLAKLESDYDKTVAGINKRLTEKGKGSSGGISISDNQLANLEAQLAAAKQYREQLLTLGAAASDLNEGERESLKLSAQIERATNAKTRAKLAEAKAMADAWGAQVRSNDELHKSQKAYEALIAGNYKAADSLAERAREQEAANSVYGKGRTEIERMTLATLENQLAEAQDSYRFSPQYIASLEAKIAAQKRWVAALGSADYKQFDDRLTKSLQTSKEALAIQQDGLSLLGLDEVQRKKVVAQRRIELDLAKELALIERTKFSDDQDENDRQRAELHQKAREKSEIDTQTSLLRIQEEYVNKQVDQYDEVFRRGFADMLNNGEEGWKSFTKSLTTTFKTTVADQIYKMFLRPFVVQVVASLVGADAKGGIGSALGMGGGGGSTGGGLLDMFGAGKSLMGSNTAGGLMGSFNAGMSGGWAGFEGGISMMQNGSMLSGGAQALGAATPYIGGVLQMANGNYGAGAGTMVGAYIGSVVPVIGTAIGAVIGSVIGGLFDGETRGANHSGAAASSLGVGNTAAAQKLMGDSRGDWYTDLTDRYNAGLEAQLSGTVNALAGVYERLSGYAGEAARSIELVGGFAANSKYDDEDAYGYAQIRDKLTGDVLSSFSNRELGTDPEKAWATYVGQMGGLIVGQLKAADIPGWMRSIFDGLGDEITVEGLDQALQAIAAVDAAFKGWSSTLVGFTDLSAAAQTALLTVSGGLEALAGNVNAFYAGYYSEGERALKQRELQMQALSGMSLYIDPAEGDAAKELFRKTVEEAMSSGQAELAAKLLAMSGAFASTADYAQQILDATADAAKSTAEAAKELARSAAEAAATAVSTAWSSLGTASGWAAQYLSDSSGLQAQMGYVQSSYAGATTVQQREAALGQIIALEQSIYQVDEANRQAAISAAQSQAQALREQLAAVNGLLSASRQLSDFAQSLMLGDAGGMSEADRMRVLRGEYASLLGQAQGGDVEAMSRLQGVTTDYLALARSLSGSGADYSAQAARMAAELGGVGAVQSASAKAQADSLIAAAKQKEEEAAALQKKQFELSGETKKLIALQLEDSAAQFEQELANVQKQIEQGDLSIELLTGLPAELGGVLGATLVPAISSIAEAAMAAASMSASSAEAARAAAASAAAAAMAFATAGVGDVTGLVPQFASGGLHAGGLRLVGERGPELEVTGPARYWSAGQTQAMLGAGGSGTRVESLLAQLVDDNRRQAGEIIRLNARVTKLLERWEGGGLPETREAVTV